MMRCASFLPIGVLVLLGCSSEDSLGHKATPVNPRLTAEIAPACTHSHQYAEGTGGVSGSPDTALIGVWLGHAENHLFDSGSDQVELVISGNDPAGRVIFGQGVPPSPATDPDVGYPPGEYSSGGAPGFVPREGVPYTFLAGNIAGTHVQLKASTTELYRDWCALQLSYQTGGECGCVPSWPAYGTTAGCGVIDPSSGARTLVDCGKFGLCFSKPDMPCRCTTTGCSASLALNISLDLTRDGDQLTGNIQDFMMNYDVVLTKQ